MRQETRNVILICLLLILALLFSLMITDEARTRDIKATSNSPAVPFLFKDEQKILRLSVTTTTMPPTTTTTLPPTTIPKPKEKKRRSYSTNGSVNWDAIANCESHGNWSINTGNGYYGGLQMNMGFWNSYASRIIITNPDGSTSTKLVAERPDLASKEEQILAAQRAYGSRGVSPWPHCGRYG